MAFPVIGIAARFAGRAALRFAASSVGRATLTGAVLVGKVMRSKGGHRAAMRVEISPSPQFMMRKFKAGQRAMADMSTPYRRGAVFLDQLVQRNFREEGEPVGGWMPLKGGGRRMKGGRLDTSAKILQDTGRLRGSFETWHTSKNAGIRSNLEYAPVHEHGLGPIPQRRMLPVKREVRDELRGIFDEHVRRSLRKVNWGRGAGRR